MNSRLLFQIRIIFVNINLWGFQVFKISLFHSNFFWIQIFVRNLILQMHLIQSIKFSESLSEFGSVDLLSSVLVNTWVNLYFNFVKAWERCLLRSKIHNLSSSKVLLRLLSWEYLNVNWRCVWTLIFWDENMKWLESLL